MASEAKEETKVVKAWLSGKSSFYRSTFNHGALELSIPPYLSPDEVDDMEYLFVGILKQHRRWAAAYAAQQAQSESQAVEASSDGQ